MSHTPGPWITGQGEYADQVFEQSAVPVGELDWGEALICETCGNEENARLIAAAPELLAALKDVCRFESVIHGMNPSAWPVIHAAIAKAEGRSE